MRSERVLTAREAWRPIAIGLVALVFAVVMLARGVDAGGVIFLMISVPALVWGVVAGSIEQCVTATERGLTIRRGPVREVAWSEVAAATTRDNQLRLILRNGRTVYVEATWVTRVEDLLEVARRRAPVAGPTLQHWGHKYERPDGRTALVVLVGGIDPHKVGIAAANRALSLLLECRGDSRFSGEINIQVVAETTPDTAAMRTFLDAAAASIQARAFSLDMRVEVRWSR